MQRMTRSGYIKKIDFVFYHEQEIRDAVFDARHTRKGHGHNSIGIADPTATQAIRNMTPLLFVVLDSQTLKWPNEWLRIIDATYNWCDKDRLIVAKGRYSGEDYRQTCAKVNISTKTYYNLLDDVRRYASLCAVQLGLIKIF